MPIGLGWGGSTGPDTRPTSIRRARLQAIAAGQRTSKRRRR